MSWSGGAARRRFPRRGYANLIEDTSVANELACARAAGVDGPFLCGCVPVVRCIP